MTNEKIIWNNLIKLGFTEIATAGILGNIKAESGLKSNNLQNSFEKKLGFNDDTYTAAVDNGSYTNFVYDKAGYGLCQWTYWSRKNNLLNFAKSKNKSIGDLEMQIEFLYQELKGYKLIDELNNAKTVKDASNIILLKFEKPKNQGESVQNTRASYGEEFYKNNAKVSAPVTAPVVKETSSKSPLVTVELITNTKCRKNRIDDKGVKHSIDTITIHCTAGNKNSTASATVNYWTNNKIDASAQYVVGGDGSVCQNVLESDRAWTTGGMTAAKMKALGRNYETGSENDYHAVTIEVASNTTGSEVTTTAYNKLVDLVTDICKRNGKNTLLWFGDDAAKMVNYKPAANEMKMTWHRWFAQKACPGPFLMEKTPEIVKEVNNRLNGGATYQPAIQPETKPEKIDTVYTKNEVKYTVQKGDTLGKIAKKYNTTVDELVRINNIKNKNLIYVGQVLVIKEGITVMHVKTNGSVLRIRKESNINSAILGNIKNGSAVNVLSKDNAEWYLVEVNGITGYCYSAYLV